MAAVEARIKLNGKHFEISVDLDEALKVKDGKGNVGSALLSNNIFYDLKKGTVVSKMDLESAFNTTDIYEVAKTIMTKGEVQKTQEFRSEERENKIRQVIALLLKNASDQHGKPYTEERIRNAIHEAHFSFDNRPAEEQMPLLFEKLKEVIPIKIERRRIKLKIPARFTGQVYGLLKDGKESEEWLANGDLQVVIGIPPSMLIDFYDKLNKIAHGAVQAEDIKI